MTLPDEQRKQIELEAKASSKMYFSNGCENFEWVTYEDGFINAATAYTALCHQKDEEIKSLRQGLENVRRCCSSCGDDPVFRDSVIKDIDSIAEETLEINK